MAAAESRGDTGRIARSEQRAQRCLVQQGQVAGDDEARPDLHRTRVAPGPLGDNVDHVTRIAGISKQLGREVASVDEARAMLKIPRH